MRRLRPRITGFAIRVLGDRSLAEDAAQETFVRLFRFLPRYRPVPGRRDGFTAWCFQIAHNACLDVAGRERRAARALEAPPRAPADPIERADVRRAIEEALARLPEPLLRTFLLRQQGLTYEDVAKVLAVPVGTVRSRLHEARMRLREMLSRSLEEYREGGDR
ncbi:MAG: RNA polymerase sigma factor [Acidobacteria bacterium]|nr:RNA polymerase sigma factor [Acidobacteriota bacterium]